MAHRPSAWILDLDGVVVDADRTNARCWKRTFDELLSGRRARGERGFAPFDAVADYRRHVDGRPTLDGVRSFLAARRIELPEGDSGDQPGTETIHALAARNGELVAQATERDGVHAVATTVAFLDELRAAGARTAVISSSSDLGETLAAAGLADRFDVTVDDAAASEHDLDPKPAPDTIRHAAERLEMPLDRCAMVGDGPVDMEAGRAAGCALVVGFARDGHGTLLRRHGADIVVEDDAVGLRSLLPEHAPA